MAILHLQVTKIIGHLQTSLIIRNTQIHGLHFCNPRTKRIVCEEILRCTQDDSESETLSNTEEEQSGNGAKKIGLPLTEQPYHKSDISIISSVQAPLQDD